ncbi:MAG TPA: PIG-L family deacetylase, partial [Gemmatimonadaceae bacterium]|nr:PIG-L family deacetylase [Gemmatimonadaceae bacterium]
MKRAVLALAAIVSIVGPRFLHAQDRTVASDCSDCGSEFRRVLVIAAHPDDEDTQLITWLSRGGRAATAYLSLTRGDGGQNLIGNELGEQLGVIRTEELLAARRIDGASQFFTRAYDFGFSKTAAETYAHWPKDSLLEDVVTVVRTFRPEVIVAVFSGTPKDGHGQHQVSAILAKEVYGTAAADTMRFPVAKFGRPWTPLKFYRFAGFNLAEPTIKINVGEYNRKLGKSYAEIAGESRSQHKSQGFGSLQRKGDVWDALAREATRVNETTPANSEVSIFDGLPPRKVQGPGSEDPIFEVAHDMSIEAIADRREVALGDSSLVNVTFYNRSDRAAKVTLLRSQNVFFSSDTLNGKFVNVGPNAIYKWQMVLHGKEITQPWWLVTPRNGDLFSPILPAPREPSNWPLLSE